MPVLVMAAGIGLASLACSVHLGGPEPPGPPIPSAREPVASPLDAWGALDAVAGEITVLFDEQQLTSYLASRLADEADPVLREPQVHLRAGELHIYGIADQGPFVARVSLAVAPRLNAEGALSFEVTSADFGPLPAPRALRESMSNILTEAFTGTFGPLATGLHIRSVVIADGQIVMVVRVR